MAQKRRTKAELAKLATEVINRRRVGMSFEAISQELEVPTATCHRVFKKAIENIPQQSATELRLLQYERLEEIYRCAMLYVSDEKAGPAFMKQALDALKQIGDLNGLNAAKTIKTELTGADGGPIRTTGPIKTFGITQAELGDMSQEERDVIRSICVRQIEKQKAKGVH